MTRPPQAIRDLDMLLTFCFPAAGDILLSAQGSQPLKTHGKNQNPNIQCSHIPFTTSITPKKKRNGTYKIVIHNVTIEFGIPAIVQQLRFHQVPDVDVVHANGAGQQRAGGGLSRPWRARDEHIRSQSPLPRCHLSKSKPSSSSFQQPNPKRSTKP